LNGSEKLWVYGSLLCGFFNHAKVLQGRVLSAKTARIKGRLFHQIAKGYPALCEGDNWVYGELLEIEDLASRIDLIDELEGFVEGGSNNEYERRLSDVFVLEDGVWTQEQAFVYWYVRSDLGTPSNPVLPLDNGDWKDYMASE
jgi:gamma-glutamylcyclotransferase (GGCT)/AIG2-like uncharacterized protein YtfP